jgi:hypothetical protein
VKLSLKLKDEKLVIPTLSANAFDGNFSGSLEAYKETLKVNLRGNKFEL